MKRVEIGSSRARPDVSLDVVVVPHVDVAHQRRPVVHVRLLVHPGNGRFRNCLEIGKKKSNVESEVPKVGTTLVYDHCGTNSIFDYII